jgi:amino acid transporter
MVASGGTYVFSIYSMTIQASLGYDQKTLNMLSFFKTLEGSLGVVPGLLYDLAPTWVVLMLGGAMNLFSYLLVYLGVTISKQHNGPSPPVWLMCFYIAVAQEVWSLTNNMNHRRPEARKCGCQKAGRATARLGHHQAPSLTTLIGYG